MQPRRRGGGKSFGKGTTALPWPLPSRNRTTTRTTRREREDNDPSHVEEAYFSDDVEIEADWGRGRRLVAAPLLPLDGGRQ